MGEFFGYMATWNTYGTWLQGDRRGYVTDGKELGVNAALERANTAMLKKDPVKLRKADREVAKKAILAEAERIGEKVLALLVWSNHVHVVIGAGGKRPGKVVSRFKTAAYYELRERGFDGRVWARGYDKRFCFDEEALNARIDYVVGHEE